MVELVFHMQFSQLAETADALAVDHNLRNRARTVGHLDEFTAGGETRAERALPQPPFDNRMRRTNAIAKEVRING